MRRPPAHEWAVLGEDGDPVPGDPDAVALLGQTLRDTADAIMREGGEIDALSSVETWQSDAADRFRGAAKDATANLRKAFHRYDVAANAMGTSVQEGSTANWASALETAQQMAAKALQDAQNADADQRAAQTQMQHLPPDTPSTDPAATSLHKKQEAAATALTRAKSELQAAKNTRDAAAKTAADAIQRAITHDGLHDSTWDKIGDAVDTALSDVGTFLVDAGENALSVLASLGNAMLHDVGAFGEVLGGLALATLAAGGEIGGFALDLTGIGAVLGVPVGVVSAAGITTGLALAGVGMSTISRDAMGPDRVNMSSQGPGSSGGDWDTSASGDATRPSGRPDPNAKPGGQPTRIRDNEAPENKLALQRENESADILAKQGYDVEQNPTVSGPKNPDYRIEGQIFDNVAPTSGSARNIADRIAQKVEAGQTGRVVLNLSDSPVDVGKLDSQLHDWPINGLEEVIAIDRDGNVLHLYP